MIMKKAIKATKTMLKQRRILNLITNKQAMIMLTSEAAAKNIFTH